MEKDSFSISEAARMAGVETHVLRYWEDELALFIARNEKGHRCYTRADIQVLLSIKELKRKGFQLKTIKEVIPEMQKRAGRGELREEAPAVDEKKREVLQERFLAIMDSLVSQVGTADSREARCKRLDAAIRSHQYSRKMAAATREQDARPRRRLFH